MRLFLMRHSRAGSGDPVDGASEDDGGLSPDGITRARAAAHGLAGLGIDTTVLLSSPLLRAIQTAEIVARELGLPIDQIRRSDALNPGSVPGQLLEELSHVESEQALCVGHSPQLDDVIAHILGCRTRVTALKKVAVACLELDSLSPPQGVLLWLYPQKVLRRMGR